MWCAENWSKRVKGEEWVSKLWQWITVDSPNDILEGISVWKEGKSIFYHYGNLKQWTFYSVSIKLRCHHAFQSGRLPLRNKLDAGHSYPSWWHRIDLWDPNVEGFPQLILFRPSWVWWETTHTKKIPQKTRWKLLRRREGHHLHKAPWEVDDDIPNQIRYEFLNKSPFLIPHRKLFFFWSQQHDCFFPAKSTADVIFPPPRK